MAKGKFVKIYRFLYIAAVFAGPFISAPTVWTVARVLNALMAVPNLFALFYLSRRVKEK